MAENAPSYRELRQHFTPYHIPELLDLIHGDKQTVYARKQGPASWGSYRDLFADTEYTVTIESTIRDNTHWSWYCITEEDPPPDMDLETISTRPIQETGLILGYPNCCTSACKTWNKYQLNPRTEPLTWMEHVPFYLNRFNRQYTILSHFPCSGTCKHSLEIGKQRFELLRQADQETAKTYRENLSGLVLSHSDKGTGIITTYDWEGDTIHYDDFNRLSDSGDSKFIDELQYNTQLTILGENQFTVGGHMFDDPGFSAVVYD